MQLVMVRHGESHWNVQERYQGQADSGLTNRGRAQAEEVAHALADQVGRLAKVWSSDLPRARDTADAYARLVGASVLEDERLREVDLGSWSGRLLTEMAVESPEVVAAFAAGQDPRRGGGETFVELRARVVACLEDIAQQDVETALVFSHGGSIRVAAAHAAGLPSPGHFHFAGSSNCSRTILSLTATGQTLVRYNVPLPSEQKFF